MLVVEYSVVEMCNILAVNLVDNCCKSLLGYCFTGAAYPLEKKCAHD